MSDQGERIIGHHGGSRHFRGCCVTSVSRRAALIAAAMVALAACGSSGDDTSSDTTSTTRTAVSSTSAPSTTAAPTTPPTTAVSYADCDAVRAAGKAPLHAGQPGYSTDLDRDGDGVACEN